MSNKADVWRERLAAWVASGVSIAAFCRTHDLAYAQFMYWQRRLGKVRGGLVPVRIAEAGRPTSSLCVALVLPGGLSMRIDGACSDDVLALVRGLSC